MAKNAEPSFGLMVEAVPSHLPVSVPFIFNSFVPDGGKFVLVAVCGFTGNVYHLYNLGNRSKQKKKTKKLIFLDRYVPKLERSTMNTWFNVQLIQLKSK